jgi:ABC-2 type transport system permease protein
MLRSEWIKLITIRSTVWTATLTLAFTAGFAGLVILGIVLGESEGGLDPAGLISDQFGAQPAATLVGFGLLMAQAFAAILGVILVTSERSNGAINSTVAAVPKRSLIVLGKLTVSGMAGLAIGAASSVLTVAIGYPVFDRYGDAGSLVDPALVQAVAGGAVYFALIAMISTSIGFLVRGTAAAAGLALGLVLIVPGLLQLVPIVGGPLAALLPTALGQALYTPVAVIGVPALLIGAGGMVAWVVALGALALSTFTRKDV